MIEANLGLFNQADGYSAFIASGCDTIRRGIAGEDPLVKAPRSAAAAYVAAAYSVLGKS